MKCLHQRRRPFMVLSGIYAHIRGIQCFKAYPVYGQSTAKPWYSTPLLLPLLSPNSPSQMSIRRLGSTRNPNDTLIPAFKENLYTSWTIEQDELLWEHRHDPLPSLAALLGRGLKGVHARLHKLSDVDNAAYQRLFVKQKKEFEQVTQPNAKLVPVSEVIRRVQYDPELDAAQFFIIHYDRVDDQLITTAFDAPNNDVAGRAQLFVDALPEHRIVKVLYRERVVWDRENKVDMVFAGPGIRNIVNGYETWKDRKDVALKQRMQHRMKLSHRMQLILGLEGYDRLQIMTLRLQNVAQDPTLSTKQHVEEYVQEAMGLFAAVRQDPNIGIDPTVITNTDYEALDVLSEWAALVPNDDLRLTLLHEIELQMQAFMGNDPQPEQDRSLPTFDEDDVDERFVRGSGPGGQKVNKTSNKVVLLHRPTSIRVQSQHTRSLQQNRKLARRLLREKLDAYYNGAQSKAALKAEKASLKKSKAKGRSRTRQRRREEANKERKGQEHEA